MLDARFWDVVFIGFKGGEVTLDLERLISGGFVTGDCWFCAYGDVTCCDVVADVVDPYEEEEI